METFQQAQLSLFWVKMIYTFIVIICLLKNIKHIQVFYVYEVKNTYNRPSHKSEDTYLKIAYFKPNFQVASLVGYSILHLLLT